MKLILLNLIQNRYSKPEKEMTQTKKSFRQVLDYSSKNICTKFYSDYVDFKFLNKICFLDAQY